MATLAKIVQLSKRVNDVTRSLTNLTLSSVASPISGALYVRRVPTFPSALFHTTSKQNDLMEFFDDPKNWELDRVRVGRSWAKPELRLKSNQDLHKLWFVLLKERNMLLTMEEAFKREWKAMPNPERIDKVQDSMDNLEAVVRERNMAYHMLETGTHGERPVVIRYSPIGLRYVYKKCQHTIPKQLNVKWQKTHIFGFGGHAVRKFLRLYREKLWNVKRKARNKQNNKVARLMRAFPNLDMEAVKEQYPDANIEKIKRSNRSRGHYVPE